LDCWKSLRNRTSFESYPLHCKTACFPGENEGSEATLATLSRDSPKRYLGGQGSALELLIFQGSTFNHGRAAANTAMGWNVGIGDLA
jgi:hypothetical protein